MVGRAEKKCSDRTVSPAGIVITPGDPAGVGPALVIRALKRIRTELPPVYLCGDPRIWERAIQRTCGSKKALSALMIGKHHSLPLPEPGSPTSSGAQLAWFALEEAVEYIHKSPESRLGLLTGPISKKWMDAIGFPYPGHTEFLKDRFGAKHVLMVMSAPRFHVALHTIHVPLRKVPQLLDSSRLLEDLLLFSEYLSRVEPNQTRIGVCGLNPHAGEEGIMGTEEKKIIHAIVRARSKGISVDGPLPADSAFFLMRQGNYGGILAVYHDQGLAPFKLIHFHRGVNVTLGLPFVRVSPDHGTAFSLAKQNLARPNSTIAAFKLCIQLLRHKPCPI